jgi:photosystem I reaction center subunit XII
MTEIQVFIALVIALHVGGIALRLGTELYK